MKEPKAMYILAIESSCDETSAAVISTDSGLKILSNLVASQTDIHATYGGVVPEIASRAHIETISSITYGALREANVTISDIGAIGVTNEPGLIGALLVGVNFAKSLAFANDIPLIPVNHVKAHVAAAYLEFAELKPPFLALVISGGHTSIYNVKSHTDFEEIGGTRDDAAGEAFDKVGRVMGLPYPGGAAMDKLAHIGDKTAYKFPSPAMGGDNLDFSFSGIKTSVINLIHNARQKETEINTADIAASFTASVTAGIMAKTKSAILKTHADKLVVAGGVAANSHLRDGFARLAKEMNAALYLPPISLCGDNGAMVAAQCYYEFLDGKFGGTSLNAYAN
jgi:putative glycoprotease GCP